MSDIDLSKIKVVFMDIGGVLLTNGWGHESRQKAAKKFGLDYSEMDVLHDFIFNVYEIGSITLDDYLETVVFHKKRNFTKEEFKEFIFSVSVELPHMLAWTKEWKKQTDIPVFALSNEGREINEYRIQKFDLHEVFDGFFSSCYLGFRKPDPRIFQKAMQIVQVKPEESLYFDDRLMLTKTARKMGMQSVHHENFEETKAILENFKRKK